MAVVIVTEGPAKEQKFSLANVRVASIGRDAGCTFQVLDPQLSRYHLQIKQADNQDRHMAIDFQSKNGVFLNGQKMEKETLLNDGDVITIGGTTMVYSTDDTTDAQRAFEAYKRFGMGHVHTVTLD